MTASSASEGDLGPHEAKRFAAIDGLRAWLAWLVVLAHIVQITGLDKTQTYWWVTQFLAREAVSIFIIVSGFVITGLVLQKQERWATFITRRAFRIFPLYLALLPLGALTLFLTASVLPDMGWASDPRFRYDDTIHHTVVSVEAAPWAHIIPHLFLFQGVIPDSLIDQSQTSFLGPAWSLSLEWQFYLIAPLLIALLRNKVWSAATIGVLLLSVIVYKSGVLGAFPLPSLLPASIHFFLLGIFTRFAITGIALAPIHGAAMALTAMVFALFFPSAFAVWVWVAMVALLCTRARSASMPDKVFHGAADIALTSPTAQAQGARSYAIYLVHWPIVQAVAFFVLPLGAWSQYEALLLIGVPVLLTTLIASHLLHIGVEKPMMRLGARLAADMAGKSRTAINLTTRTQP